MKLTDSEWLVMNALWERQPATARQIAENLPDEVQWAYTTLKTVLSRLVEKKCIAEEKVGNTSQYTSILSQKKARKSAFSKLMDQAFDGAFGSMLHFLIDDQPLTEKQRAEILKILHEEEQKEE